MGNCATTQYTRKDNLILNWQSTAKIVDTHGRLQEFKQPIKAKHILSQNPNCFLCSSESMYVNCHVPHVPDDEELQLGQLYFLMPLSKSTAPLSLPELCALAVKASAALPPSDKTRPYLKGNVAGAKLAAADHRICKIPVRINIPAGTAADKLNREISSLFFSFG